MLGGGDIKLWVLSLKNRSVPTISMLSSFLIPSSRAVRSYGRHLEVRYPNLGEPVLGLPYCVVKRAIGDWMERKHIECWKSGKDCKHSKALMEGPQQGRAIKLLNISRQQLSVVIGLLT